MDTNWDPARFVEENICAITIAAGTKTAPYLCLVEECSGWKESFVGLLEEAANVSIPGFQTFYGSVLIGQITATRVRGNPALQQQVLSLDNNTHKVLILYLVEQTPTVCCFDLLDAGKRLPTP